MSTALLTDLEGNCTDPALTQEERNLFFSNKPADQQEVIRDFCATCPVAETCLSVGIETAVKAYKQEVHGVWGGRTSRQIQAAIGVTGARFPAVARCIWCNVSRRALRVETTDDGGRWPKKRIICDSCGFSYYSTPMANALEEAA